MIDGIDRLGKGTLVQNILDKYGYHLVIHYDKPKLLQKYSESSSNKEIALRTYQVETNQNMFELMKTKVNVIFDRTHLGEMVYAPLYRGYNGDYIYKMEMEAIEHKIFTYREDFKLILLTTSNFDMLQDDGLSFDFSKKEFEQAKFIEAFKRSSISNKTIVDVHDGKGGYKNPLEVLRLALEAENNLPK